MVIDVHYHPAFFEEVCGSEDAADKRRKSMAYYKTPRASVERIFERMTSSGVDQCFLLPHDYSTIHGDKVSNEEISELVRLGNGRFYGFASVDPELQNAPEIVEHAFKDLKLSGLKLHPSKQRFFPADRKMYRLYEVCRKYNKPVVFHSGFTWQPDAPAEYSHPLNFEQVAMDFPDLRMCLAHMGFPWIKETAMLLLKYPNLYADTGVLYFDSAYEFYDFMFKREMPLTWLDRSIRHQVMFGSNMPRFEEMRMLNALRQLGLREETFSLVTEHNARVFLGEEEQPWLG